MLVLLERFLVYPAPPAHEGEWNAAVLNVEEAWFEAEDGTVLHGFYAHHPDPKAHILYCHGNGEHMGYLGNRLADRSRALQASIFAFDYRGYGKSEGTPHEAGLLMDGEAAAAWLAQRAGVRRSELVLHGCSLGGAIAVHLAATQDARALVVERTFHSMVDIGAQQYPWAPVRWLMRNRYPSASRINAYAGPMLQFHGEADTLVPIESARILFEACPSPTKQFISTPGVGHNDAAPREFREALMNLIGELPPIASQG